MPMSIEDVQERFAKKKAQAAVSGSVDLLMELSHEISNFARAFKGKVEHTFVMSPAASDMFGFSVQADRVFIGVPDRLMDIFMNIPWTTVSYIPGKSGLFLRFYHGAKQREREVAIRLVVRSTRVELLSNFNEITLIRMNDKCASFPEGSKNSFELKLSQVSGLEWERS
jgi:hypothetical protein